MKTLPGITCLEYCTKGIGVQTVDPIIQSPGYSQSYNGYSYCFNNPLKFADPFGFTAVATALDMVIELWNQTGEYGGYYGPSGPVSYSKTEAETLFWAFEYLANEIGIPYWRFGYMAYLSGFVSDSHGGTGFVLSLYNLPDLNWSFQINQKSNYYFILDPWDNYYSNQKAAGKGGNGFINFIENTSVGRDATTVVAGGLSIATDVRIPAGKPKFQPRGFNPAVEAQVAKGMKVANGVVRTVGTGLGVFSAWEHGNQAYEAFSSEHIWQGIGYSALTGLDIALIFVRSNPAVLVGTVIYGVLDATAF